MDQEVHWTDLETQWLENDEKNMLTISNFKKNSYTTITIYDPIIVKDFIFISLQMVTNSVRNYIGLTCKSHKLLTRV